MSSSAGRERANGFVLAGGESRRMGQDKALVPFCGRSLIENALEILRKAGLETRIAGSHVALEKFAPVVVDTEPDQGPLGGICAALATCESRRAVFLPVDLPLLPASLITQLIDRAEIRGRAVTVASLCGFAQTFPVVVDRSALRGLEAELKAGRRGCFAAFQAAMARLDQTVDTVAAEYLAQPGYVAHTRGLPAALWFQNVNDQAKLRQAEEHCGRPLT